MNVLLIGPRFAGKTTIGRALARRRGVPLVDLDDAVLASFDQPSVRAVWAEQGEKAWRQAELVALTRCMVEDGRVVSLGGGVPEIPEAAERIRAAQADGRARVVYLQCPVEVLRARMAAMPGDRPPLSEHDPAMEIEVVLKRREPIYLDLADEVVEAGVASADDIAIEIDRLIRVGPGGRTER